MSKTVTFTDATWAEITSLVLGINPAPAPAPAPAPSPLPPGVAQIIDIPWQTRVGTFTAYVPPNQSIAFRVTVPVGADSHGASYFFKQSPNGGNDYYDRILAVANSAGDFSGFLAPAAKTIGQESSLYFYVKTPKLNKYTGVPDLTYVTLMPGLTYYFNVKNMLADLGTHINYGLQVPTI